MSEIKFRAFIPIENEYVYCTHSKVCFALFDLLTDLEKDDSKRFELKAVRRWIKAGNQPDRYTGCKDKNGNDIYENDIVKEDDIVYLTTWSIGFDGDPAFVLRRQDNHGFYTETKRRDLYYHDYNKYEIIGNAHQHPELLEVR